MTKLHYLELNDNKLTGHIPPALGQLTNLFDLNVANNNLDGPLPDNLSSCTNLNSLNVHGNKLNGTIPPAFQRLESITYLNLSSNNLKGPIPIELSKIGNLDTLYLMQMFIGSTRAFDTIWFSFLLTHIYLLCWSIRLTTFSGTFTRMMSTLIVSSYQRQRLRSQKHSYSACCNITVQERNFKILVDSAFLF